MKPQRIQLRRTKGWRMPPNTVSVARPGLYGNPYPVDVYGQEGAVDLFRRWLQGNMSSQEISGLSRCDRWSDPPSVSLWTVRKWVLEALPGLGGKNLACWCRPRSPCHADVLLELANSGPGLMRGADLGLTEDGKLPWTACNPWADIQNVVSCRRPLDCRMAGKCLERDR